MTREGGRKLMIDGYAYRYHHTNNDVDHYYCAHKDKFSCKGKLQWDLTANELFVREQHCHEKTSNMEDVEFELFKVKLECVRCKSF